MELAVKTSAASSSFGGKKWFGVLLDQETERIVWACQHNSHPSDVEAEFCAVDFLTEEALCPEDLQGDSLDRSWNFDDEFDEDEFDEDDDDAKGD